MPGTDSGGDAEAFHLTQKAQDLLLADWDATYAVQRQLPFRLIDGKHAGFAALRTLPHGTNRRHSPTGGGLLDPNRKSPSMGSAPRWIARPTVRGNPVCRT